MNRNDTSQCVVFVAQKETIVIIVAIILILVLVLVLVLILGLRAVLPFVSTRTTERENASFFDCRLSLFSEPNSGANKNFGVPEKSTS